MEIMIPVWPDSAGQELAKSDLRALRGVEVAFVDDNLDADYTEEVEKQLIEVHGAIVHRFLKPLGTAPSPASLIDQAAQYQVAVIGMAM